MSSIEELESRLRTAELLEQLAFDVYVKALVKAQQLAAELVNVRIRQEETNEKR